MLRGPSTANRPGYVPSRRSRCWRQKAKRCSLNLHVAPLERPSDPVAGQLLEGHPGRAASRRLDQPATHGEPARGLPEQRARLPRQRPDPDQGAQHARVNTRLNTRVNTGARVNGWRGLLAAAFPPSCWERRGLLAGPRLLPISLCTLSKPSLTLFPSPRPFSRPLPFPPTLLAPSSLLPFPRLTLGQFHPTPRRRLLAPRCASTRASAKSSTRSRSSTPTRRTRRPTATASAATGSCTGSDPRTPRPTDSEEVAHPTRRACASPLTRPDAHGRTNLSASTTLAAGTAAPADATAVAYVPPHPESNTGMHRLVFCLLEQSGGRLDPAQLAGLVASPDRCRISHCRTRPRDGAHQGRAHRVVFVGLGSSPPRH